MSLHPWKIVASQYVFERPPYIKVRRDDCEIKQGRIDDYYLVERPDFATVFALTTDGRVPLVRQYRHGSRTFCLELPAGFLHPAEDPALGALRELREETGYEVQSAQLLGVLHEAPATSTIRAYCFLATHAQRVSDLMLDDLENIEVELLPFEQVVSAAGRAELTTDSITMAAIFMAAHKLSEQSSVISHQSSVISGSMP